MSWIDRTSLGALKMTDQSTSNQQTSISTLELVLEGLFDYAGMFPPASLSFEDSLVTSAQFIATLQRPYLVSSDMVISYENLSRLNQAVLAQYGFEDGRHVAISILGAPIGDRQSLVSDSRLLELTALQAFNQQHCNGVIPSRVVSYEIKLDKGANSDLEFIKICLRHLKPFLADDGIVIYLEPDLSRESWKQDLLGVCNAIVDVNQHSKGAPVAFKVRGSGPTGLSREKFVDVIDCVCSTGLDFKATAGMHHPLIETELHKNEHGFLGVVAALYLRKVLGAQQFSLDDIRRCIAANTSAEFEFNENLAWDKFSISAQQLLSCRES
jgi:hypothetical protein